MQGMARPSERRRKRGPIALASGVVVALIGLLGADDGDRREILQVKRHLARIGVEMHRLKAENGGRFPASAILSKTGEPLLSWRVALLPMLGEAELYRRFRLDEPWDSPANKPLLAEMPAIYAPFGPLDNPPGSTFFQAIVGPGTWFDGPGRPALRDFADGGASTLLIVEAAEAVPWTKPADLAYDPKGPLPRLGGHSPDGSLALFADGSVAFINVDIDPPTLKALMTRHEPEATARRTLRDAVVPIRR